MGIKRYRVLGALYDGIRRYAPGDDVELDIRPDDPLIIDGTVQAVDDAVNTNTGRDAGAATQSDDTDNADATPGGGQEAMDREARLLAAIGALEDDNAGHWTKKGKPEIAALEAASGLDGVSAKERDAVWAAHRTAIEAAIEAAGAAENGGEDTNGETGTS